MNSDTADFLKAFETGLEKGFAKGFEKGKEYEHRWWSEHCASCTDADRPQGEWEIVGKNHPYKRCPFCKRVRAFTDTRFCDWCGARMKGADDEV